MQKLQVNIAADVDHSAANGYEAKIAGFAIALPDNLAPEVELAILAADQTDAIPGDGKFEKIQDVKFPVKINLFITHLNVNVDIMAIATIEVTA